jgi:hypothetical protein
MNRRLLLSSPAVGFGSRTTSPVAVSRPARRPIGVMLVVAAAPDLTRCDLVMVAVRHPASAAGLVMVGLAAAALSVKTARGCQGGQRWSGLGSIADWRRVGAAGGRIRLLHPIYDPRHGHRGPRGTAGRGCPGHGRPDRSAGDDTQRPCVITGDYLMIRDAAAPAPAQRSRGS